MQRQWLFLLVEKKIEKWHSLLRAHTQSYDDTTAIEKVAKTLATSGFLTNFWGILNFVPKYTRRKSSFDYWMIAEFMLQVFSEIAKNMMRAHVVSIAEVNKRMILFSVLILRQFLSIMLLRFQESAPAMANPKVSQSSNSQLLVLWLSPSVCPWHII